MKDKAEENNKSIVARVLAYANVVGNSITRFDTKGSKRKKNNHKNKKHKPR